MTTRPSTTNVWIEPESAANTSNPPVYPFNNITQSESGHTFELDDTKGRERVRLQHRSGTFIEMHPNGDEVHKVYGDGYEITIKDKNVLIKGACNITIEGDCNMEIRGDKTERVHGDYNLEVRGDYNLRSVGEMSIDGDKDISIAANENFGGSVRIKSADNLTVSSDLVVAGSISADVITSESRMNAGMGVYAGPHGVYSMGPITSVISCQAPLGLWGTSRSILMTDSVNTRAYNSHVHTCPDGTTGTPSLPMV